MTTVLKKVTVKKKTPKGTYKVNITIAANVEYDRATTTLIVKVKK